MLKNTESSYGLITRIFHWLMSIMIIILIIVGFAMSSMEPSEEKWAIYGMHKATGVIVLLIATARLLWRQMNQTVAAPIDLNLLQKFALKFTHILLYICMFLMPISGIIMSRLSGFEVNVFGFFTIPAAEKNKELAKLFHGTHEITAFILVGLIILHFLAAMYHHFIRKDNVLLRMIK